MLEELSRATEKFLEEASKYGEVSYSISVSFLSLRVQKLDVRTMVKTQGVSVVVGGKTFRFSV